MASCLTTSWQIKEEKVEAVTDFIFWGSKVIVDGNCSHEIKRCFLLGRNPMTNLDIILKSKDRDPWTMGSASVLCRGRGLGKVSQLLLQRVFPGDQGEPSETENAKTEIKP